MDIDTRFMAAAIRLARRNEGLTATNPSVACLIVRDDVIVGSGVTARGGRPHAEPVALAEAGALARPVSELGWRYAERAMEEGRQS